jgi:SAM-dependent methyltransferase
MDPEVEAVAPSNTEQARAWDGDEGRTWAEHADEYDDAASGYHPLLLDATAVDAADRVLDVGCGTGQLTCAAARTARDGEALGVDLSSAMLEVARRRAEREGVSNARFRQADAQVHPFPRGHFDLVTSRFGVMFFGDPAAAFRNLAASLRPAGRLAVLCWRSPDRNEWLRALMTALSGRPLTPPPPTAPGPFSLADPQRTRDLLEQSGFADVQLTGHTASMRFGRDLEQAEGFVMRQLGWMLGDADQAERAAAVDRLRQSLTDHQTSDGVRYGSAAWLVSARRPEN